jgi:hypothetical protein
MTFAGNLKRHSMKSNYLILLILFTGCNHVKSPLTKNDFYTKKWNTIIVKLEQQEITFFSDSDTAYLKSWFYKDTVNRNNERVQISTNNKIVKFVLNNSDRDTLFSNIYDLIKDPVIPKDFCTDYVGNVTFRIKYNQVTLGCSYTSVCSWEQLSPRAKKIKNILEKKIKIIEE